MSTIHNINGDLAAGTAVLQDADQLAVTTMDPGKRTLRRITAQHAEAAERVFELLMGNDVGPRRDFIVAGGEGMDRARIDA